MPYVERDKPSRELATGNGEQGADLGQLADDARVKLLMDVQERVAQRKYTDGLHGALARLAAHELSCATTATDRKDWFVQVKSLSQVGREEALTERKTTADTGKAAKYQAARGG